MEGLLGDPCIPICWTRIWRNSYGRLFNVNKAHKERDPSTDTFRKRDSVLTIFAHQGRNRQQSYQQLLLNIRAILKQKDSQKPQLSKFHPMDVNWLFNCRCFPRSKATIIGRL
ncbi:hypothetical protein BD309DRAFT_880278 [Dichomitus squalens]|uniref:Uncharacterized protein n=1 Tax=Dichomitus squalens TaxID=114155 RepID=A0A4Q9Q7J0_9APHY|nr:uncharacterized protein DICSQDRAFT_166911 [Dichomitus squalens LYAD-421 SS1]EJF64752.1 hypothetical protein DICSQDRAFT_166911 [Dichomitus squalens LYAD-421 SS1]TBU50403.1 hypothetical protein BD309DRAFT_880278 [Dichomitus squalens]TBU62941.1 hypothetical protein BD310DRAFT_973927 [Dichomitus squalens]